MRQGRGSETKRGRQWPRALSAPQCQSEDRAFFAQNWRANILNALGPMWKVKPDRPPAKLEETQFFQNTAPRHQNFFLEDDVCGVLRGQCLLVLVRDVLRYMMLVDVLTTHILLVSFKIFAVHFFGRSARRRTFWVRWLWGGKCVRKAGTQHHIQNCFFRFHTFSLTSERKTA